MDFQELKPKLDAIKDTPELDAKYKALGEAWVAFLQDIDRNNDDGEYNPLPLKNDDEKLTSLVFDTEETFEVVQEQVEEMLEMMDLKIDLSSTKLVLQIAEYHADF